MYTSPNIGNCAPGRKLIFLGFVGKRPATAAFALERAEAGLWRIRDILYVPIDQKPTTMRGFQKTRALESLVVVLERLDKPVRAGERT